MTPARPSLRLSRIIRADAATLFRAWTDPEELSQWWRQEKDGWAFAGASIDLRVGGRYRLGMTDPDGRKHFAVGLYREIRPPVRLVSPGTGRSRRAGSATPSSPWSSRTRAATRRRSS
jgi:uncharacterized protein YndB with AHSA1/START domain